MAETSGEARPARRRYLVGVLLFLAVAIAYVDRINIAVAGPAISDELGLSPGQLGLLLSAFFWSYTLLVVPMGWLCDRYGSRVVMPLAIVVWSLGAAATGLMNRFTTLIGARLLLGAGEAPSFPAGNLIVREWAPLRERAAFTGALSAGALLGPAVGSVAAAALIGSIGWRGSFFVLGGLGLVVAVVWVLLYARPEDARWLSEEERQHILASRQEPEEREEASTAVPMSLGLLLRQAPMWGLILTQGCQVYTIYLFLTWLPGYLVAERGLDLQGAGFLSAVPYGIAAVATILLGRVSDRLVRADEIKSGGRRKAIIVFMLLACALALLPFIQGLVAVIALIAWVLTAITAANTLNFALASDLIVDRASGGRVFGLVILGGNSFGLLAPIITGFLVQATGSFTGPFAFAVALILVGALISWILVRRPLQPVGGRPATSPQAA